MTRTAPPPKLTEEERQATAVAPASQLRPELLPPWNGIPEDWAETHEEVRQRIPVRQGGAHGSATGADR